MTHTSTRSILLEEDIDKISKILGDDMLTMEEKERFMNTIEEVNNDKTIMQEWMLEENERLKNEGQMSYAREEGLKEGLEKGSSIKELELIKNMLTMKMDYNIISQATGKTINEIKKIEDNIEK